jgi:hypothetical protein
MPVIDAILLTNPDFIKQWLGVTIQTSWIVGQPISFTFTWEGKAFEDKGNLLELEALKVFSYNYWSGFSGTDDSPENYSIISFTLFNQDDHTILKLKQLPTKVRCRRHSHHLSSFMDRSLPLPKNLPLLMVRFPPIYLHSSINLLHQHQAH